MAAWPIRQEGIDMMARKFKQSENQGILKCGHLFLFKRQCKQIIVSSFHTNIMFVYQTVDF